MGKLLNLDELIPDERTLVYKGVEYKIGAIPLRDYLAFQRDNAAFAKSDAEEDKIKLGIQAISLVIPTFPASEVEGMSLRQITALMNFVTEIMSDTGEKQSPNPPTPAGSEMPATET